MKVKQQEAVYIGIETQETVTLNNMMEQQHVILQQQD